MSERVRGIGASRPGQHSHLSPRQEREREEQKGFYWEVMVGASSCQESCFSRAQKGLREGPARACLLGFIGVKVCACVGG